MIDQDRDGIIGSDDLAAIYNQIGATNDLHTSGCDQSTIGLHSMVHCNIHTAVSQCCRMIGPISNICAVPIVHFPLNPQTTGDIVVDD